MKRPLVFAVMSLIAGQIVFRICPMPEWALWAALTLLMVSSFYLLRRAPKPREIPYSRGILLIFAFALIGALGEERCARIDDAAHRAITSFGSDPVDVQGVVCGTATPRERGWSIILKQPRIQQRDREIILPAKIQVFYSVYKASEPLPPMPLPGQHIRARGVLRFPEPPGNPEQFDYATYMRAHGIAASMSVGSTGLLGVTDEAKISLFHHFLRGIQSYQQWSAAQVQRYVPAPQAALLRAMLFGETYLLQQGERDALVRTGLAHLLAVSGQHATLITLVVFAMLCLFSLPWRTTWIITVVFIWIFTAMVGFQPPVMRAAIVATALAAAQIFGREPDSLHALSLAALIVLLIDPRSLYKADFQLSYLCILSMILLNPVLSVLLGINTDNTRVRWRGWALRYNEWLATPLRMTIATQLGLAPVLAFYFHQFSLIGVPANLLLVLIASFAIVGGFLIITFGALIPPLAMMLGAVCNVLLIIFDHAMNWMASLPFASIALATLPAWAFIAYYFILFSGIHMRPMLAPGSREKGRAQFLISTAALIALLVWLGAWRQPSGELMVRMLDVGQGDSIFIRFPTGQTMLIDGGAGFPSDKGKSAIVPYLRASGVSRLNLVLATHGDGDHIGGLPTVLRSIKTDRFIMGEESEHSKAAQDLQSVLQSQGILRETLERGDLIQGVPNCRMQILNPPPASLGDENADSVVMRLDYGHRSFLFTGDASFATEKALLDAQESLDCDVLKVAHHGAATASGLPFLHAVTPDVALISVAARNRYGHPAPIALQHLADEHARIYRTDRQGSIAVFTDGENLRVETNLADRK